MYNSGCFGSRVGSKEKRKRGKRPEWKCFDSRVRRKEGEEA